MKIYKVKQSSYKWSEVGLSNEFIEPYKTICEDYYDNFKKAKDAYYKMKKHYLSCKPDRIIEDKGLKGDFANMWMIKIDLNESTYKTSLSEIDVQ